MRNVCLWLVLSVAGAAALAADDEVQRLKLRAHATVYGEAVRLTDVLVLTDVDETLRQHLAEQVIASRPAHAPQLEVTHDQVVKQLDQTGVNLARVLVNGALDCEVTFQEPTPEPLSVNEAAPLLRTTTPAVNGSHTLADLLQTHMNSELEEFNGRALLQFERAGEEFLQLTTTPWDFNITSVRSDTPLGLREFRVVIRRDGRVQRTVRIFAQVRMERQVAVAKRPLSVGTSVRADDIALEVRVFEPGAELGYGTIEAVIGQQVRAFVPRGDIVGADAIQPVDLVRRSRPVTVVGAGDSVQIRLTGVALDSGGFGDVVRVRLGQTRDDRRTVQGVVTGLGTVRIDEGVL